MTERERIVAERRALARETRTVTAPAFDTDRDLRPSEQARYNRLLGRFDEINDELFGERWK